MGKGLFVAVMAMLVGTVSAQADDFDLILPAPENHLKSIISFGAQNDADFFGSFAKLCDAGEFGIRNSINGRVIGPNQCGLPALADQYKQLAENIFSNTADVELSEQVQRTSPWDIRELLAGNFMPLPDRNGAVGASLGLQKVVTLFYLRTKIGSDLRKVQIAASLEPGFRSERQVILVPSLQAYIQTSSPLGAMIRVYSNMQCQSHERLCLAMKARMGSAIGVAVQPYIKQIAGFRDRLMKATDEYASERLRKLRDVNQFAAWISSAERSGKVLAKSEIELRLKELVADGQGAFSDEAYQGAARAVIVLIEVESVTKHLDQFTRDRGSLSRESRERAASVLNPLVKESVDSIERAFQVLGLANDFGGTGL